ncbi:hypothetical protein FRC19_008597 [Serendipita sp. 401]|nr:hypothetical protein FRC15_007062 [Serendipita sp. 397]KAG8826555.1 hypothetical protein FRC19_008597 [Serendipita sp. 401]
MPPKHTHRRQPRATYQQPNMEPRNTPSPFEEGLSFESDSDLGPLYEDEFVIANVDDDDLQEHMVEEILYSEPCMFRYPGDAPIPVASHYEMGMVAEAMSHWAALYIWSYKSEPEEDVSVLLIDNMKKLHSLLRLNTEMIAHALWIFDIIYDNPQFVTQSQKGFPNSHTFRRELGDETFEIFAAYVVSLLVVLNLMGNDGIDYCTDVMQLNEETYHVLLKLRSAAQFILQECRLARINPEWSNWLGALKRAALETSNIDISIRERTIVSFSFEIARSHRIQEIPTYGFFAQWLPRILKVESDIEMMEILHQVAVTHSRQQEVTKVFRREAQGLVKWAAGVLEHDILCFEVGIQFSENLMHIHMMFHLPTMHTAFTLWNFSRIWSQERLKDTIYERFPEHEEERVIVFIYLWSAYMTTLILDDGPPMTPDSSLRQYLGAEFFLSCYNATLKDLDYRLQPTPEETLDWLENMVFWTKELELIIEPFIINKLSEGLRRVQCNE